MKRSALLFAALALFASCQFASSSPVLVGEFPPTLAKEVPSAELRTTLPQVRGISIRGQMSVEEYQTMAYMADLVKAPVWSSVMSITIDPEEKHFGEEKIVGHCHRDSDTIEAASPPFDGVAWRSGDICLKPEAVANMVFWHEVAHAYHLRLVTEAGGGRFEIEWKLVAGDVYGPENNPPEAVYPGRGLLRAYSGESFWEDVADTYMYVLAEISDERTPYDLLLNGGGTLVFAKKVRLLWEYGFITAEDFGKFAEVTRLLGLDKTPE